MPWKKGGGGHLGAALALAAAQHARALEQPGEAHPRREQGTECGGRGGGRTTRNPVLTGVNFLEFGFQLFQKILIRIFKLKLFKTVLILIINLKENL